MGDLVGTAGGAAATFVPPSEVARLRASSGDPLEIVGAFAAATRLNALGMIHLAGSGHIGSSFSSLDVVSYLLLEHLEGDDVYFSSKGHDVPGYYAAMLGLGRLDWSLVSRLRRLGGLPGHPDISVPGIAFNTGSLGMGIAKAKGLIRADRLAGRDRQVVVMTGDGELQEGQIWESLATAARDGMRELTVIVDHNRLQSDMAVARVSDLGDIEAKFAAFGWAASRCDGHDLAQLREALVAPADGPRVIVAETVKGRGFRRSSTSVARTTSASTRSTPARCPTTSTNGPATICSPTWPSGSTRSGSARSRPRRTSANPWRASTSTARCSGSCPPTGRRCWRPAGATSGSWRSTPT
jgi:transketolase